MGLWDNTTKSLVTRIKHQYWAEDKKLGKRVEKGIARGPRGVCRGTSAGAARALQGQALSWPITTDPSNELWPDHTQYSSTGSSRVWPRLVHTWTPAECVHKAWKLKWGFGWYWVLLWGLLVAVLSAHPWSCHLCSLALPGSGIWTPQVMLDMVGQ